MEKSNNQEQIDKKYLIIEKVGTGGQANVFLVKDRQTEIKYVAKVLKEEDNTLENEIKILQNLKKYNNPYIINIIDSGEGEIIRNFRKTKNTKYCILENAPNGTIFDYLYCKHIGFGELYGKFIFQKILKGIQLCHQNNICHRDIKLENILLDENFNPKICDFGYACYNQPNLSVNLGTSGYKPPEICLSREYDGFKADIFCLGVTLMILVTGSPGFDKATRHDPKYHIIMIKKYDEYWKIIESQPQFIGITLSKEFKNLYIKMIAYNPKTRPSVDEILNHSWFNEINNMSNIQKNDLEKGMKVEFTKLVENVKENMQKEIQAANKISETAKYNRKSMNEDNMQFFNYDIKPKFIYTPINMNYSIKINGYIDPNQFMNDLGNIIIQKFGIDNCFIESSKNKYKLTIIFEEEIEKDEVNEDPNEDIEIKDKEESNEITIQIILYKDSEGYILKFVNKEGNRKIFLDIFNAIYKIVQDIIC